MRIVHEYATEDEKNMFFSKLPISMFKYRSWRDEYHRRILTENELYFSSPKNFNDPYDCGLPYVQHPSNADPAVVLTKVEELAPRKFPELVNNTERLKEECAKQVLLIMQNPLTWFEMNWGLNRTDLASTFGIISLTEFYNKELLWSHYADSHKGFCVEFNTRQLFEGVEGSYSNVEYVKELPVFSILDNMEAVMEKLIYTKSIEWQYEKEHRIAKIHKPNTRVTFPSECLIGIYFGVNMRYEDQAEIINIAAKKFPNVRYYNMTLSREKFELIRGEMNLF
jgi:hypothetical protein